MSANATITTPSPVKRRLKRNCFIARTFHGVHRQLSHLTFDETSGFASPARAGFALFSWVYPGFIDSSTDSLES